MDCDSFKSLLALSEVTIKLKITRVTSYGSFFLELLFIHNLKFIKVSSIDIPRASRRESGTRQIQCKHLILKASYASVKGKSGSC